MYILHVKCHWITLNMVYGVSKELSHKILVYNPCSFKGKIYFSPPNDHPFSGWHPELPTLALRPPKLPTSHFLALSVSLSRQIGWKLTHVRRT
jgi:hypothetical protein